MAGGNEKDCRGTTATYAAAATADHSDNGFHVVRERRHNKRKQDETTCNFSDNVEFDNDDGFHLSSE